MTSTDILVLLLLGIFFVMGWRRGLLRSLVEPVCLAICSVFGIVIYDTSHNLIASLLTVLIATFFSIITIKIMFAAARHTVKKEERDYVFLPSRVVGACVSTVWQGMVLGILLIIAATIPTVKPLQNVQEDIARSASYFWINTELLGKHPSIRSARDTFEALTDPTQLAYLRNTAEYQNLYNHPDVRAALNDPDTVAQIREKNIPQLLTNPKFKAMMKNDHVMKSFTEFSKKVYKIKSAERPQLQQPNP